MRFRSRNNLSARALEDVDFREPVLLRRLTNRASCATTLSEPNFINDAAPSIALLILFRKNIFRAVNDELLTEYRVSFCSERLAFYGLGKKS